MEESVAAVGEVGVVGDDDEGAAVLTDEVEEEIDDGGATVRVQVAGGFVGEDDAGIIDEGAGDGDALLFAAAELGGEVVEAVGKAHAFEEGDGGIPAFGFSDEGGEEDVLESGEFGEEKVGLEDEAHAGIAQGAETVAAEGVEGVAFEVDGAAFWGFEACEGVEEGGLAGAGGSAEEDGFCMTDREGDFAEDFDAVAPDLEGTGEVASFEVGCGGVRHGRWDQSRPRTRKPSPVRKSRTRGMSPAWSSISRSRRVPPQPQRILARRASSARSSSAR